MFPGFKLLGINDEGVIGVARLVSVYTLAGGGYTVAGGGGAPSAATAVAKCLPILCLAIGTGYKGWNGCVYSRYITLGLLLSACGDALLVWEHLAAGMGLFAAALLVYTAAQPTTPLMLLRGAVLAAIAVVVVWHLKPPPPLGGLVPLYAACVAAAAWRGGAARGHRGHKAARGLELFALSDTCLAAHMFYTPLPCHQLIVMGTYYTAQLLIALSALADDNPNPARLKTQ